MGVSRGVLVAMIAICDCLGMAGAGRLRLPPSRVASLVAGLVKAGLMAGSLTLRGSEPAAAAWSSEADVGPVTGTWASSEW